MKTWGVASLALDTGSYMVSGKTVTDHGLSALLQADCSVVRVLEKGSFCVEEQDYQTAAATLEPLPDDATLELAEARVIRYSTVASLVSQRGSEDFFNYPSEPWTLQAQIPWSPPSEPWSASLEEESGDGEGGAIAAAGVAAGSGLANLTYAADDLTPVGSGFNRRRAATSDLGRRDLPPLGFLASEVSEVTEASEATEASETTDVATSAGAEQAGDPPRVEARRKLLTHSEING